MSEPGLSLCDVATQGVWANALNAMFLAREPFVEGTKDQLSRLCRCRPQQLEVAALELHKFKVAIVKWQNDSITIESRRFRRELELLKLKRESGLKGAQTRWQNDSKAQAEHSETGMAKGMADAKHPLLIASASSTGDEDCKGEGVEVNGYPTMQEVLDKSQIIGLAPWKGKDWWEEMDGCGWIDHAGRKIKNWQSVLNRVRTKWEEDGRPMGPPKSKAYSESKPKSKETPYYPGCDPNERKHGNGPTATP
ncbi:MAG: hypothetical protein V4563_14825 [Pseudomonadota bacterium]